MKIINPSFDIMTPRLSGEDIVKFIELCGRVCYKTEDKATDESGEKFVGRRLETGHESTIEHYGLTVRFICDRGVSHELVRHRLASFSQESTRYCNYAGDKFGSEITVIKPCFLNEGTPGYAAWESAMKNAEYSYFRLLDIGHSPQEARSVLPNSLKTEVIMTANLREWRHIFRLRTSEAAHPQMRELMIPLCQELQRRIPVFFDEFCHG